MAHQPLTIPSTEHQEVLDKWALAIGRFMVHFTGCEYWTYQYIKTFGSDRLRETAGELMLSARGPMAKALVLDIGLVPDIHTRVEAAFSKLDELAKSRNLVAHNGPLIHAYLDKSDELDLMIELRSARDESKSISIQRLDELTDEARRLDDEFAMLYGEVRKTENHLCG